MFGTFRKHQTWLWAIIIVVIVISFVIYFDPSARWSGQGRMRSELGTIDGQPVTIHDYQQAQRETRLLYFLNFQKWPEADTEHARQMNFDVENEAYMRLIRLAKVKQEKIQISDEAVAQLAQRILGPKIPLDTFVKEALLPAGVTEQDFERFLRNDAAIQQLGMVAGLPGKLVPPREIEAGYREDHEEVALDAVIFSVSNYLSSVSVTESNLLQWYSNNASLFRVPEKARVSYVEFARSNYFAEADKQLAEITNLNFQIEQAYAKQDPSAFKDSDGKVLSKEAAIQKIKDNDRNARAMRQAMRLANDFAGEFYDQPSHTLTNFESFAAKKGIKVRVSEPFDEVEGPQELKVGEDFARTAFALTNKDEAVAFKPAQGEEGFYVYALKEIIPSMNPSFTDIRAKVVERYRFAEAQKLVRMAGYNFQFRLTNGLAQGKTFMQAVTESSLKATSLPPISRATRQPPEQWPDNLYLPQVKNVAFGLQDGKASPYVPTMDGGFVLYLRSRMPISETRLKSELAEYAGAIRAQRQNEAFGLWFRRAAERADLPINRPGAKGPGAGPSPKSAPKSKTPAPRTL